MRSDYKQEFLAQYKAQYNHGIDAVRKECYPQLKDTTYLDFAAATPYSTKLIDDISEDLKANLFGNPHSLSSSSQLTTQRIDDVRLQVLQLFHGESDYDVVFVQNTTAAIKLVADVCADAGLTNYICHQEAHTSLVGIRNLIRDSVYMDSMNVEEWLNSGISGEGLLAYPLQSNFSGAKFPWAWSRQAKQLGYHTLLDAAGFATTSPIDLRQDGPDFMAVSFLKMFGYPDLAGLFVRKENTLIHKRRFFGGGTVAFLMNSKNLHVQRKTTPHDLLEDGTPPFHAIIALDKAIKHHMQNFGSIAKISSHCSSIASFAHQKLSSYRHSNEEAVVDLYSDPKSSVLTFNIKKCDGTYQGYNEIAKLADISSIQLRTGGLCNSGCVMKHCQLSEQDMFNNMAAGKSCDDETDIMNGKPVGAIRISFGAVSTIEDAIALLKFVEDFFVEKSSSQEELSCSTVPKIEQLSIFPIKSCAGVHVPSAKLTPYGFQWDREWCLVHLGTGKALSQKQFPRMALIQPRVTNDKLIINVLSDTLILDHKPQNTGKLFPTLCTGRVCTDNVALDMYHDEDVVAWFTDKVGTPCTLARCSGSRESKFDASLHLSNESPLLVVNGESYRSLAHTISTTNGIVPSMDVFRANIVVSGLDAWSEDQWRDLVIGSENKTNKLSILAPCRRCQMICIDQSTGTRNPEPYSTLSKTRKQNGKVFFGMHAKSVPIDLVTPLLTTADMEQHLGTIQVGDLIMCTMNSSTVEIENAHEISEKTGDHDNIRSNMNTAIAITNDTISSSQRFAPSIKDVLHSKPSIEHKEEQDNLKCKAERKQSQSEARKIEEKRHSSIKSARITFWSGFQKVCQRF